MDELRSQLVLATGKEANDHVGGVPPERFRVRHRSTIVVTKPL
jgi:hypothetical protein